MNWKKVFKPSFGKFVLPAIVVISIGMSILGLAMSPEECFTSIILPKAGCNMAQSAFLLFILLMAIPIVLSTPIGLLTWGLLIEFGLTWPGYLILVLHLIALC